MPSASATPQPWSGPAPPKATSSRSRGSCPCSTLTTRIARTISSSATATIPSAAAREAAEAAGHRRDRTLGRTPVERQSPGQRLLPGEPAQHQVRVGHGRQLAAAAVAGRSRDRRPRCAGRPAARRPRRSRRCCRRLRRPCGCRASAGAPAGRPPSRSVDRPATPPRISDDVAAGAAHVERHRVAGAAGDHGRHAARRAGQQQPGRVRGGLVQRAQAAARLHQQRLGQPALGQPLAQPAEVARGGRPQVGVDGDGRRPLVLAVLGGDLVRGDDECIRQLARAGRPPHAARGGDRRSCAAGRRPQRRRLPARSRRAAAATDSGSSRRMTPSGDNRSSTSAVDFGQRARAVAARAVQMGTGLAGELEHVGEPARGRPGRCGRRAARAARWWRPSCRARGSRPTRAGCPRRPTPRRSPGSSRATGRRESTRPSPWSRGRGRPPPRR